MINFWYEAVFVLETLYNKCRGADEDGVDLYFTSTPDKILEARGDAGLKSISEKMWNQTVRPQPEREGEMCRPLKRLLDEWLDDWHSAVQDYLTRSPKSPTKDAKKNLTIIVLTDGIWNAHRENPLAVDDAIVTFNQRFKSVTKGFLDPRTVSIQFVSFGNDQAALARLRRLDDSLGQKGVP